MNTFLVVNAVSVLMALPPWGMIPYGNIPLQRLGIGVQTIGLVVMLGNVALLMTGFYK